MSEIDDQKTEARKFADEVLENALVSAYSELTPLFQEIGMLADDVSNSDVATRICKTIRLVFEILRDGRREFDQKFPQPESWPDDYEDPLGEIRYDICDEVSIVASAYALAGGDEPDADAAPKSMLGETYLQFAIAFRFLCAMSEVRGLADSIRDQEEVFLDPSATKSALNLLKPKRKSRKKPIV